MKGWWVDRRFACSPPTRGGSPRRSRRAAQRTRETSDLLPWGKSYPLDRQASCWRARPPTRCSRPAGSERAIDLRYPKRPQPAVWLLGISTSGCADVRPGNHATLVVPNTLLIARSYASQREGQFGLRKSRQCCRLRDAHASEE
jgi:hypothetical protein